MNFAWYFVALGAIALWWLAANVTLAVCSLKRARRGLPGARPAVASAAAEAGVPAVILLMTAISLLALAFADAGWDPLSGPAGEVVEAVLFVLWAAAPWLAVWALAAAWRPEEPGDPPPTRRPPAVVFAVGGALLTGAAVVTTGTLAEWWDDRVSGVALYGSVALAYAVQAASAFRRRAAGRGLAAAAGLSGTLAPGASAVLIGFETVSGPDHLWVVVATFAGIVAARGLTVAALVRAWRALEEPEFPAAAPS